MPPGVASTCMKLLCIFIFQGYSIYIYTYIDAISLHVDMRHPKYVCICLFDKSFHSVQNHFHTHFTKWKRNAVLAAFFYFREGWKWPTRSGSPWVMPTASTNELSLERTWILWQKGGLWNRWPLSSQVRCISIFMDWYSGVAISTFQ